MRPRTDNGAVHSGHLKSEVQPWTQHLRAAREFPWDISAIDAVKGEHHAVTQAQVRPRADLFLRPFGAQSKDQPSRYVWWETFQTAVGKTDVFSKVSMQFREVTAAAVPDVYWVVGKPITGEDGRLTFVTFHDNMASIEKMLNGLDKMGAAVALKNANVNTEIAESETSAHWALAEYSKELSYRPDMVPTANTTWWSSSIFSLRPGCEDEFADVVKQVIELHKKANDNEHWTAYEVRAGMPEPSVFFVTQMKSLADADEEPNAAEKELFDSAPMKQMFHRIGKECIEHVQTEFNRVNPRLSRMPQAVVAASPDFWNVKEEAAAPAPKKGRAKKETVASNEPGKK